jgi:inhibitor of KinA sporulation pathway (predicted exonuclease)
MIKSPEIYTCIDLEMNADGKRTYEIIQIGAVIGNIHTGEILEKLSLYINIGKSLYPFITDLTGITDNTLVTKGTTLLEAYNTLKAAHIKHNAHTMLIQWGHGDEAYLKHELLQNGLKPEDWIFGRRNWDVKTICQSIQLSKGASLQGGLKKNCNRFGVQFKGPAHTAEQDAENTFYLFKALLPKLKNI